MSDDSTNDQISKDLYRFLSAWHYWATNGAPDGQLYGARLAWVSRKINARVNYL